MPGGLSSGQSVFRGLSLHHIAGKVRYDMLSGRQEFVDYLIQKVSFEVFSSHLSYLCRQKNTETMNFCKLTGLCLSVAVLLVTGVSCEKVENDIVKDRTVFVYFAGDNDLSVNIDDNINGMVRSMSSSLSENCNLIAFIDRPGVNPKIIRIHDNRYDVVRTWDTSLNSASPELLSELIEWVVNVYPADSYGLVLWSHGTGWIPSSVHPVLESGSWGGISWGMAPGTGGSFYERYMKPGARWPFGAVTKAIMADWNGGSTYKWMEYNEMASAIPDNLFDFILFDACNMASAEVAYQLRGKARWMIASAIEVVSQGFPYDIVTPYMFNGDYISLCRKYYEYYESKSGTRRTAGIALVDLDKMDSLAESFSGVVSSATVSVDELSLFVIQTLDRFSNHVMFDLMDFASHLRPGKAAMENLEKCMGDCILYHACTEYVLGELKIDNYCGLSAYVPVPKYAENINPLFRQTEWNRAVGLLK